MPKEFKAIDEQIELLKKNGLKIEDEETAREFLKYNSYDRITWYFTTLRKDDKFIPSASMQNIIDIYRFDHEFRACLFNILTKIEVNIRSILTYYFTEKYGVLGYRDKNNFIETKRLHYEEVIARIDKHVQRNINNEEYLKHFAEIKQNIPFGSYVESFTFSDLSKFYGILKIDLQKNIAVELGLEANNGHEIVRKHLNSFTFLRNICAHGSRLFNRRFITKPNLKKKEKTLLQNKERNDLLFGFVLIIKRYARPRDWKSFMKTLVSICDEYPSVDMSYYGFCNDWKERL